MGGEKMLRIQLLCLAITVAFQFGFALARLTHCLAQEWEIQGPKGAIRVVDMYQVTVSAMLNYAEGLVTTDKDNVVVPCLASNWRWLDDRTIEFKLRKKVLFHNGEEFDANAVKVNWEAYRNLENPRVLSFTNLPDETKFEIIDKYTVRFTLPAPDAFVFIKFAWFFQIAPSFFQKFKALEKGWLYFPEAGPWGTGPFKFVKGIGLYSTPSEQIVLEANEDYWDVRYPRVQRVIFENTLLGDRDKAMRLCEEEEGRVDVINHIRPLDTLRVAESRFGNIIKSMDVTALGCLINGRKKNSRWRDPRLRKALNYAINREELWKYCARGNARNLAGFIPQGAFGYDPALELYSYDTKKAISLLTEAGFPNGLEVKLISAEAWKLEAQFIGKMLERVGIRTKREILPMPALWRRVYGPLLRKPAEEQDWDISMWYWFDLFGHTGATFLTAGFSDGSDLRWIKYDHAFEKMWKDMAMTIDTKVQEEKIRQMVKRIYDDSYAIFLYSPMSLYAVNRDVNFVPHASCTLRLKETSVTDNHWSVRGENN